MGVFPIKMSERRENTLSLSMVITAHRGGLLGRNYLPTSETKRQRLGLSPFSAKKRIFPIRYRQEARITPRNVSIPRHRPL